MIDQDEILQLVMKAHHMGMTSLDLTKQVKDCWEAMGFDPADAWLPSGMSMPDEYGLVKFRAVEAYLLSTTHGEHVRNFLLNRFGCQPALAYLDPASKAAAALRINGSTAAFYQGAGIVNPVGGGGEVFYWVRENPDPQGPRYLRDTSNTIPLAWALPSHLKTVDACVERILQIARRLGGSA